MKYFCVSVTLKPFCLHVNCVVVIIAVASSVLYIKSLSYSNHVGKLASKFVVPKEIWICPLTMGTNLVLDLIWYSFRAPTLYARYLIMVSIDTLDSGPWFSIKMLSLQWCHNGHGDISKLQAYASLLNRLFRHRWKKTPKLHVTGLCEGIHRCLVNSPHKGPVTGKICRNLNIDWMNGLAQFVNAALVMCVNLKTFKLYPVITRWFYMPVWFYLLKIHIYVNDFVYLQACWVVFMYICICAHN